MLAQGSASSDGYAALIGYLQRAELDALGGRLPTDEIIAAGRTAVDLRTPLPLWLVRVDSIPRSWQASVGDEVAPSYLTADVLAGLCGHGVAPYMLVRGEPQRVRLYLGAADAAEGAALRALLLSQYAGARLWPEGESAAATDAAERERLTRQWRAAQEELETLRRFLASCGHIGLVTGIPAPRLDAQNASGAQLDRLIRGLYGSDWAMLVSAMPERDATLVQMQLAVQREQIRVEQEEGFREQRERAGQSVAAYYYRLLDMQQSLLENCLYEGGWWVQVYLCAPDAATYQGAKALVKSVFSGDDSRVDRLRVLDCPGAAAKAASFSPILVERGRGPSPHLAAGGHHTWKYHTLVSSRQLSAWMHLPRTEMPGYYLQDVARFDVASHVPADVPSISIGGILDRGRNTGNPYRVPLADLTKHALVVGITGSGKTNTVFYLLQQLQRQEPPIPFLVIEPAKREYRALTRLLPPDRPLRVFTVGEEGAHAAPFRLNPFEIRPGVAVQTHINLLKSVFDASFGMWTPLPQILERAIHEVYRDRGWDPVYSTNARAATAGGGWHLRAQPTLSDLAAKVAELVPELGYEAEIAGNIRTALETRINSLRVGAKGLMLDTPRSVPLELLLQGPTVLELEGVGDDDERAFIMGLLLVSLYETYQAIGPPASERLVHVTVVEEAHRLLANVPMSDNPEAGNLRGKAVETFVNMLAEVRAYGEGLVIAEQIPGKLSPDVIKNTALKVMHRLVASDDRQAMGGAMNVDAAQFRQVVALGTGVAVVHGGGRYGDDNPMLVQVPQAKGASQSAAAAADVRRGWEQFRDRHSLQALYAPYPTCSRLCSQPDVGREPGVDCMSLRPVAEHPLVAEGLSALVTTLVAGYLGGRRDLAPLLGALYADLAQTIRGLVPGQQARSDQMRCTITHALYRYIERRGAQYGWPYAEGMGLIGRLLPPLVALADGQQLPASTELTEFCSSYGALCQRHAEPFSGCAVACGRPPLCLYRYSVAALLRDEELRADLDAAEPTAHDLAAACENAAERVLAFGQLSLPATEGDRYAFQSAALCYFIQQSARDLSRWPSRNRRQALSALCGHYLRPA